jgi:hypothetical protein
VIREATCGVFLTTAKKYFNCENIWGRPENDIGAMSDHLDGALKSKTSLALPTEDALALHANSTAPLPGRREGMALKMFWAYALQACATDQPAGLGCFSLVWRGYRRHLHRHIMKYNL